MPNPLNLSLASEVQPIRAEVVNAEIVSIDELEEMSISEVNRAKKELSKKKQRLQLQLDGHKLSQATKIMNNMDMVLNRMAEGWSSENVSAMDLKFLTEAYKNLLNSLNMISRLDSVDGTGRATKLSIEVKYKEA